MDTRDLLSLSGLEQRLSSGAHPQVLIEKVVEAFIQHEDTAALRWQETAHCIDLLSRKGTRVATGEPGCALENLIRKTERENADMIEDIARRLMGRPGEIPFHVIAQHFPILLSYSPLENPDIKTALHARDPNGRTVSHYLWGPQSIIVDLREAVDTAGSVVPLSGGFAEDWLSAVRRAWITQEKLQEAGLGMDIPDDHGVTALDLCVERYEAKDIQLLEGFDICKQVKAYQDSRALDAATPLVNTPAPAGPRL